MTSAATGRGRRATTPRPNEPGAGEAAQSAPLPGGRLTWIVLGALALGALLATSGLSLASRQQERRLLSAVPGFACAEMDVETGSAGWSWNGFSRASSALYMPAECGARLERLVARSGYERTACGQFRRCWRRTAGADEYGFEFGGESVLFRSVSY